MSTPITFLAQLHQLDTGAAGFLWKGGELTREQFERGEAVLRVAVEVPRSEWEKAGRPTTVTAVLADLTMAEIDQPDALARAWADGYTAGRDDVKASERAQKRGEEAGISVNPYSGR